MNNSQDRQNTPKRGTVMPDGSIVPNRSPKNRRPEAGQAGRGSVNAYRPNGTGQNPRQSRNNPYSAARQEPQEAAGSSSPKRNPSQNKRNAVPPQFKASGRTPAEGIRQAPQKAGRQRPVAAGMGQAPQKADRRRSVAAGMEQAPQKNGRRRPQQAGGAVHSRKANKKSPSSQTKHSINNGGRGWIYPENGAAPKSPGSRGQQKKSTSLKKNKAYTKKKRIAKIKGFFGRFLICAAAVCFGFSLWYFPKFNSNVSIPSNVKYIIEKSAREAPGQTAYKYNQLYVCFSDISSWLGMAEVGDIHSMRFVFAEKADDSTGNGHEENAVFHSSSQTAYVNNSQVILSSPARFIQGRIWVPIDFITDYMDGIDVKISNGKVEISLSKDADTAQFSVKACAPIAPVPEPADS